MYAKSAIDSLFDAVSLRSSFYLPADVSRERMTKRARLEKDLENRMEEGDNQLLQELLDFIDGCHLEEERLCFREGFRLGMQLTEEGLFRTEANL